MTDRAQHTAPESLPSEPKGERAGSASEAVRGGRSGASAGVTGDDGAPGSLGGSDAYPADGASPDRGGSADRD